MSRVLLLLPLFVAGCGGAEAPPSFAAGSPASTAAPGGYRVPVATVLEAEDPGGAARSPLLAVPTATPAGGHEHHHHHHGAGAAGTSGPMGAPAVTGAPAATGAPAVTGAPMTGHEHHQHGGGGAKP